MRISADPRSQSRRILIVNPNSIGGFGTTMRNVLKEQDTDFALDFYTAPDSVPEGLDGMFDSVISAATCMLELEPHFGRWQALVIACVSAHPMVSALRERVSIPVVSILEAPLLLASMLGSRTGILTSTRRWELLLARDIESMRLGKLNTAGIVSSGITVLEFEELDKAEVCHRLTRRAATLLGKHQADVIVLGCAGMVGMDQLVAQQMGHVVPILCPVKCGVALAVDLVRLQLQTSKVGSYAL